VTAWIIDGASLARHVDAGTYARGRELLVMQHVQDVELSGAGRNEWHIGAVVTGSKRSDSYDIDAHLVVDDTGHITSFSSTCTCPVGRRCKHAVAATLRAAQRSGKLEDSVPLSAAPFPILPSLQPSTGAARNAGLTRTASDSQHAQQDQALSQWLDLFEPAPSRMPLAHESDPQAPATEQIVFTLHERKSGAHPQWVLGWGFSRQKKSEGWLKLKRPDYLDWSGITGSTRNWIESITGAARLQPMGRFNYGVVYEALVHSDVMVQTLEQIATSGRLWAYDDATRSLVKALHWGDALPLQWSWQAVKPSRGSTPSLPRHASDIHAESLWQLQPLVLAEGQAPAKPGPGLRLLGHARPLYWQVDQGRIGEVVSQGLKPEQIGWLLQAPAVPTRALETHQLKLASVLGHVAMPPMLAVPRKIEGLRPELRLSLSLRQPAVAALAPVIAQFAWCYGDAEHRLMNLSNTVLVNDTQGKALIVRDIAAEQSIAQHLRTLGLHLQDGGAVYKAAQDNMDWLHWADEDFAPLRAIEGLTLALDSPLQGGLIEQQAAWDFVLGEDAPGQQWFDLSLGIRVAGEQLDLAPLLPAILSQLRRQVWPEWLYLPLADGRHVRLPSEELRPWLELLIQLHADERLGDSQARVSRMELLSLGAGAVWQGAQRIRRIAQSLHGACELPDVSVPVGLQAQLRPYQHRGLQWLQFLREHELGGILADDMGLGKTIQTLAHIQSEHEAARLDQPVLIIAPVSLMGNWRSEAQRFAPGLRVLVWHGAERHAQQKDWDDAQLVIAPYSLLQRERERWTARRWHLLVLDEAQHIKNANTQAAQVVHEINARQRLCLTGTPMENHLGELWSLFHALMPGFLGSARTFKELFRTPIEKQGDTEALERLRRRVRPFMLRRHKSEVAAELPAKQTLVQRVELQGAQANLYETIRLSTEKTVRDALSNQGLARSHIQILDALLKLRQVCCDPHLVKLPAAAKVKHSAKLELLMEMLPELIEQGRRVLVFSQFTSMLELIEAQLRLHKLTWVKLTGQSRNRSEIIDTFKNGDVPLFLISLKAGGVGLNLTEADTVIHYDPWWNPAAEDQATDRAHRIGQTQQVMVYKLVTQGTIEERMLAMQERKAALASGLYGDKALQSGPMFSESDLAELLKPLGV
jgi:superfamily II DNA or RNA helicase